MSWAQLGWPSSSLSAADRRESTTAYRQHAPLDGHDRGVADCEADEQTRGRMAGLIVSMSPNRHRPRRYSSDGVSLSTPGATQNDPK